MVPRARQGQRWGQSGRGKGRATDRAGGWLGEGRRTPGSQPLCLSLIPWANSLSRREGRGQCCGFRGPWGPWAGWAVCREVRPPTSWNSRFPGTSAPCFVQGVQRLGLGPCPPPALRQSVRARDCARAGGGTGGQRDRQPCPQPPWLTCTLLFPVPPGLVDSDLPLVPARC